MTKSISPLLGAVIIIALTIVISFVLGSFVASLFQSQTQVSTQTQSVCTGTIEISHVFCSAQPPQLNSSSLILLHFDEGSGSKASDTAGYDNNATVLTSWTIGKFSYALYFNGSSGYANTSSLPSPQEISIEFWVKPE